MLFEQRLWTGLADGSVTVTFRRWRRPRARPGGRHRTPAGVLAVAAGRERLPFKADVRKLKELGLTESLEVGYQLSPRGRVLLGRVGPPRARE